MQSLSILGQLAATVLLLLTAPTAAAPKTDGPNGPIARATAALPLPTRALAATKAQRTKQEFSNAIFAAPTNVCGTRKYGSSKSCGSVATCIIVMSYSTHAAIGCLRDEVVDGLRTECIDEAASRMTGCDDACESDTMIVKCTDYHAPICRYSIMVVSTFAATKWFCDTTSDSPIGITTISPASGESSGGTWKSYSTAFKIAAVSVNSVSTPANSSTSPGAATSSPSPSPSTPSTTTPPPAEESKPGPPAGPIAGGVVGGVAGLAILIALAFFYGRRSNRPPPPPDQPTMGYRDPNPPPDSNYIIVQGAELAGSDAHQSWGHNRGQPSWGSSEMAGSLPVYMTPPLGSSPSPGFMGGNKVRPESGTTDVSRLSSWNGPPGELAGNGTSGYAGYGELQDTSVEVTQAQSLPTIQEGAGQTHVVTSDENGHTTQRG